MANIKYTSGYSGAAGLHYDPIKDSGGVVAETNVNGTSSRIIEARLRTEAALAAAGEDPVAREEALKALTAKKLDLER